jgi:hypothetical protein
METQWTDKLQRLVDLGNSKFLKNFKLKLEMYEDNDQVSFGEEKKANVL